MQNRFRVISIPGTDTALKPVILLTYEDQNYLFNCGEGTQRQLLAQKFALRKIRHIFLTQGWHSHGGVAGLLLGMSDEAGLPQLNIHGPKNIAYFLASLRAGQQRNFRESSRLSLEIEEFSATSPARFEDSNISVVPVISLPDDYTANEDLVCNDSTRKGLISRNELEDPARAKNIAQSVWTGQMLHRANNGVWSTKLSDDLHANVSTPFHSAGIDIRDSKRVKLDSDSVDISQRLFRQYMQDNLPSGFDDFPCATSYLITAKPLPGRFDPARAKALGVEPGPAYGRLQRGQSVASRFGTQVRPDQVMGPERRADPVLLLECPSLKHITNLVEHERWRTIEPPALVIHSVGPGVLHDARYLAFAKTFDSAVHLVSDHDQVDDGATTNEKSAQYVQYLQEIVAEFFPNKYSCSQGSYCEPRLPPLNGADILKARMSFDSSPIVHVDSPIIHGPEITGSDEQQRILAVADYLRQKMTISKFPTDLPDSANGITITTLGTGSAGPSNYRNVASTIVKYGEDLVIMFDCGEATVGQLNRAFGRDRDSVLRNLRMVFISHLHADHHLGTIGLISAWETVNRLNELPLIIVCPYKYSRSILEYANISKIPHQRLIFIDSEMLVAGRLQDNAYLMASSRLMQHLPELTLNTTNAIHSARAMSVRIDHIHGWSVAYSGDSRPCDAFVALGRGVSCLIHEATFEDEKQEEAVAKKHSTMQEALDVAQRMEAKVTILTHFSQRYPKLPIITEAIAKKFSERSIVIAFDLMHIPLKSAWKAGHVIEALLTLDANK